MKHKRGFDASERNPRVSDRVKVTVARSTFLGDRAGRGRGHPFQPNSTTIDIGIDIDISYTTPVSL